MSCSSRFTRKFAIEVMKELDLALDRLRQIELPIKEKRVKAKAIRSMLLVVNGLDDIEKEEMKKHHEFKK